MKYQTGISLVQLLISSMLGLLLSAALLNILYATMLSNQLKLAIETVQENAALAGYFLIKDLNGIGFSSCFERPITSINNLSMGPAAEQIRISGYVQGIVNQYRHSDAIKFITVSDAPTELINDMATVHASVDLDIQQQVKVQQEVLITDCIHADIFRVSSIWQQRLTHDLSDNLDANLSMNYPAGSLLYPLTKVRYKLAKGAGGQTGLYRSVNSKRYQELIPNVHLLRIYYGVRSNESGQVSYQRAATRSQLTNLVSLRIELVLMSSKPVLQQSMSYQNAAGDNIPTTDKRFYKNYQLIIALRNNLNKHG